MTNSRRITACALATSLFTLGCGMEPADESAGEGDEVDSSGISAIKLYGKRLGPDHTVAFFDFGGGALGVREELPAAERGKPRPQFTILDRIARTGSLAEAYRVVNPGAPVPPGILQADQRAQAVRREMAKAPRAKVAPPRAVTSPGTPRPLAQLVCSEDEWGDGWSGEAFLELNCERGYPHLCVSNQGTWGTNEYSARWSTWKQYEGDFREAGHVLATKISCNWLECDAREVWINEDLAPRRAKGWTTLDGRDRFRFTATSPCGHANVAFSWEVN